LLGTLVMASSFATRNHFFYKIPTYNQKNDWVHSVSLKDIQREKLAAKLQFVSRIMVWGAISNKGKLTFLFIGSGVKINQHYYIKQVLQDHLLQHAQNLYREDNFCFQ
jgi:hypothetical protein